MIAPLRNSSHIEPNNIDVVQLENVPEVTATFRDGSKPECRICLQASEDGNELVTLCNCIGSIQYIHIQCFKVWIDKKCTDPKAKAEIYSKTGIKCQLCKEKYHYDYTITYKCSTNEYFVKTLDRYKLFAICLLGFVVLDVGLLIALTWFAINDKTNINYNIEDPRYFLIYISISVAMAGLIFVIYEFTRVFLVDSEHSITPVNKIKQQYVKTAKDPHNQSLMNENLETNASQFGLNRKAYRSNL